MSKNISTREAYGKALADFGQEYKDMVVLDADVSKCTMTVYFAEKYPNRFFNVGISEADMVTTAAGLATCGKIPFVSAFAVFAAGRAFDQVRNSVAYPKLNVKIGATHAGITIGEDGGTHQSIEDIALMRAVPNMAILSPADAVETRAAVKAALEYYGPVYIRLGRPAQAAIFNEEDYSFELGKGAVIKEGNDAAIFSTGVMTAKAIEAAEVLKAEGINARVVNIHTIKPIDRDIIIKAAKETKGIVTVEDHNVIGGLGSAISEVLAQEHPAKMKMVGIEDQFGVSGTSDQLMEIFGLSVENIVNKVKGVLQESIG
ncbi:transketolase subunit B [Ruminiclostridium sufflavum DSM 19573]|uniref:Transketolase subunit B n=1 Tax=Ruminiclostridium sufflavum DSM 19573 TaxID=1121337 RepID=A0A318XMU0_9FIRM|nr:transketolase family protein [Ruminiclostridium sufflavum]PYG87933.1 transketolase subunit B [Ruminiclostridium sufflavum DSM 19573]